MTFQKMKSISYWMLPALMLVLSAQAPAAAADNRCQGGDRVLPVTAFGQPRTTFSREPASTEADLQRLFVKYEADLREVLDLAGYEGNQDDLFAAVKAGEAVEVSLPYGTEFDWMAFRKAGKPACVRQIMWKNPAPFPAWSVKLESGGYEYTMTVPKTCLNLGMVRGHKVMSPPPSCDLKASFDADTDTITVRGATDGAAISVNGISGPNAAGDTKMLESAGANVWTYKPTADGAYAFTANARLAEGSQNTDCSARVDVVRRKPKFDCATSVDPESRMIDVDCTKSVGDVTITGIELPDGSAGDLSALAPAGANRWSFDSNDTLPLKPGDYVYTFAGVARLNGYEDSGTVAATVNRPARGGAWVFRFYGAGADTAGDALMVGPNRQDPNNPQSPFVTTKRMLGDGEGFGLGIERLFNRRYGVELDALFLELDGSRIVDIGTDWTMSNPGVDMDAISLGLNVHLTPEKKVDVFIGPFLSNVSYGDSGFNATESSFGDELGLGAKLGADWYFGWQSKWALATSIRYLPLTAGDKGNQFDVDPLVGTIGLGYRF
jgi:outer membrane protein W